MGADFVTTLTSADYTPVIVFMTDGQPEDSLDISLKELRRCKEKKPAFKFFAVGFGTAYNRVTLEKLSDEANNN
jgi:uncharacterized protein YegL